MKTGRQLLLLLLILPFCNYAQESTSQITVNEGKIERFVSFPSVNVLPRTVEVWLPSDYESSQKYPVIYFHDGQMLFDSTQTFNKQEWKLDETAGQLINEETINPFIVVAVWNTPLRHSEYFPNKPFLTLPESMRDTLLNAPEGSFAMQLFQGQIRSDAYLSFLVDELKPFVDSHYSTLKERENTFIAGSSMGGLISMYAMCEYPDVFGGAACLSTHWPGIIETTNNPVPQAFVNYLNDHIPASESHKWYFDHGTETLDSLYANYQQEVDSVFYAKGYDSLHYLSLVFPGDNHTEIAWAGRLHKPLIFLLPKQNNSK